MRIERIEVRFVEAELDKPFGWSQRWTDVRSVIVLKVTTDDGIVGWGETYGSQDSVPGIATVAQIAVGEDPSHIGKIWHKLHRAVYQLSLIHISEPTRPERIGGGGGGGW